MADERTPLRVVGPDFRPAPADTPPPAASPELRALRQSADDVPAEPSVAVALARAGLRLAEGALEIHRTVGERTAGRKQVEALAAWTRSLAASPSAAQARVAVVRAAEALDESARLAQAAGLWPDAERVAGYQSAVRTIRVAAGEVGPFYHRMLGPLPVWQWGVVAAGAVGVGALIWAWRR